MNTGRYNLREFLAHNQLEQIIIPEIQRDYVWQKENVISLLDSILNYSIKQAENSTIPDIDHIPPEIRDEVVRAIKKKAKYCNVGFIYAYPDQNFPDRYILIDGQQRMTTLFLILLCLSVKDGRSENFRRLYFKDEFLKIDYKVREATHDFMLKFVIYILDGGAISSVTDQYWYYSEYQQDKTIKSILANYEAIYKFINNQKANTLTSDYVENNVEFIYFNTSKSAQGEELYIYMNSRGEKVSEGENIKALLLKGLSDFDKKKWGAMWEDWQNFFWKQKENNPNADKGLEEFLKWIQIIESTKANSKKAAEPQANSIKQRLETHKLTQEYLSLPLIERYFRALQKIVTEIAVFNMSWLAGNVQKIDYLRFLPALMYAVKHDDANQENIQKYARFFFNISRQPQITKSPLESLSNAIWISDKFLENDFYDVVDLLKVKDEGSFNAILTPEEISKLDIYKQSEHQLRNEIETIFNRAEDFDLYKGRISFLWESMNFDTTTQILDKQKLEIFDSWFQSSKELFLQRDDLLRRALLTKRNYSIHSGTSRLGQRYSFLGANDNWQEQLFNKEPFDLPYRELLRNYHVIKNIAPNETRTNILEGIIKEFLLTVTEKNWLYYFVENKGIFQYCEKKFVCFSNDSPELGDVFLLASERGTDSGSRPLTEFI